MKLHYNFWEYTSVFPLETALLKYSVQGPVAQVPVGMGFVESLFITGYSLSVLLRSYNPVLQPNLFYSKKRSRNVPALCLSLLLRVCCPAKSQMRKLWSQRRKATKVGAVLCSLQAVR